METRGSYNLYFIYLVGCDLRNAFCAFPPKAVAYNYAKELSPCFEYQYWLPEHVPRFPPNFENYSYFMLLVVVLE